MRVYEPIWDELKTQGFCKVAAPKARHARIIKAVKKEKYMDYGFKFQMHEDKKIREIRYFVVGNMITFRLKEIGTIDTISVEMI